MEDRHKNRTLESDAERLRNIRSSSLNIESIRKLTPKQKARRRRTTKSAVAFIEEYCTACSGGFLRLPPPESMRVIIEQMQESVQFGTAYHIRMPRGHGKSSYVKGVTMWALACGHRHFVEVVGASQKKAQAILRDVWNCIERSKKFGEDFPEIRQPIDKLAGKTNRAKSVTVAGEATNIKKSADEFNLPTVADSPSSGAICISAGFTSNVRGAVFGDRRPDLIIFDDLQDAKMAASAERVADAVDLVRGDFLGSNGHMDSSSSFMTSTPIQPDDLSEFFARDPAWRTATYTMVPSWPEDWISHRSDGLWSRYIAMWRHEMTSGNDPHEKCNAFYIANRAAMDKGGRVLNDDNHKPNEVSGIQHAFNLLIERGEKVFLTEYQMRPHKEQFAFDISARLILKRVRVGVPHLSIPDGFVFVSAATDINPSYALTTAIVAFDRDRTAFVVEHVVSRIHIDSLVNDTAYNRSIYEALAEHGRAVAALGVKVDAWGIDAGGKQFDAVTAFAPMARQICGMPACAMAGRASMQFNPLVRSRLRDAINRTVLCGDERKRRWILWDADHYKETSQRSWATETGSPGGCSMFDGVDHDEFAIQIANERLVSKTTHKDGRTEYRWKTKDPHDFGDCMAMCYAIAASQGISGDVHQSSRTPVRRIRKGVVCI